VSDPRSARRSGSIDLVGAAFVGLGSLQFGGVVLMGRLASRADLTVPAYLMWRFGFAAVLLALVVAVRRLPPLAEPGEGWKLAGLGAAGYATEAVFFFAGLNHGTAATVTLLFYTYPVIVLLLSLAFGRGLPGALLGGSVAATTLGSALVVLSGQGVEISQAGVVFALAAALTFSFYLLGADHVLKETNSLVGAMYVSASASAGLVLFAFLSGQEQLPRHWDQWGPILGAGAFTAGAFVCLFAGLRRLGAMRTSVIASTEPLNAAILAALFLSESIRPGTALGGALILAGAIAASLARVQVPPGEPSIP
jgi:drug/metabolite transporter (DMT)-like permease